MIIGNPQACCDKLGSDKLRLSAAASIFFFAETWFCLLLNKLCFTATLRAALIILLSFTDKIK